MSIIVLKQLKYDRIIEITQRDFTDKSRPDFSNGYRKAMFFLIREGLFKTLRKIKSKKNDTASINKKYTFIKIGAAGKIYGNLSVQTSADKDDFVICNQFFEVESQDTIDTFLKTKRRFNQFEEQRIESTIQLPYEEIVDQESKGYKNGVFVYGLGDYSRVFISNEIKKIPKICCIDYNKNFAELYAKSYGFENFKIIPEQSYGLLKATKYPLAIIATYHSDHSRLAKQIFEINKNALIFIEKPPCVTLNDLDMLMDLYSKNAYIEIGYNRRYIPINQQIKEQYKNRVKVINISVKEIIINDNHWYFWSNQGTRITGNLTHWIDLCTYWIDERPVEMTMLSSSIEDETIGLSILYSKGTLVNISVSDKGNSLRGVQEIIEIRTGEETILINDYKSVNWIMKNGRLKNTKYIKREKGHETMYQELIKTYESKGLVKYTQKDLIYTTIITFFAAKMFKENLRHIELSETLDLYLEKLKTT